MELHLYANEVERIVLEWAEKELPGRFNTLIFRLYSNEIDLLYVEPKKIEEKKEVVDGTEK